MAWNIEVTDEFADWFHSLSADIQDAIAVKVEILMDKGPALARPFADSVAGSRHPNLKELRITHRGGAYRVVFAFDPRQVGILLMGGRKAGKSWYKKAVPRADNLYDEYLSELRKEGLIW